MAVPAPSRDIYTVARLNREVRALLESGFPSLWIEGELSNLARPASGHLYFSLKDAQAQVRCAMWRNRAQTLGFRLEDGAQVLARARLSLYEPRGEYQLIVEHLEPAGDGRLKLAYEALVRKLSAEGLFDAASKRPLPDRVRRIGVVTSPSGAAIHDVLTTLARRAPWLEVVLYPSAVQGAAAAAELAAALAAASARAECDVLLLARGGGSLEDLWCFNDERVARAIRACRVPVVSGVGHEVDVTIADLAADVRAPTPTAAAELVAPDGAALRALLADRAARLGRGIERERLRRVERLAGLARRLEAANPRARLAQRNQRVDELDARLRRAALAALAGRRARLERTQAALAARSPAPRLAATRARFDLVALRARGAFGRCLDERRGRLIGAARALDAVSPLATLARGYAIVMDARGRVLADVAGLGPGDAISARLARGRLHAKVTGTEES
jgi:exodeoxyribonuclease VII large subunit